MTATAFPLCWPPTMPRSTTREKGQFKTQLAGALGNVRTSIHLFGKDSGKPVDSLVISSNVTLGSTKPEDPGVALWFAWEGMSICIPVDRYQTVESNLQAIHLVLEARRTELRHGTLALVRATFTGFLALPAPASHRHWHDVFGFGAHKGIRNPVNREMIERRFREMAKERHPDAGGTAEDFAELTRAKEEALREIRS